MLSTKRIPLPPVTFSIRATTIVVAAVISACGTVPTMEFTKELDARGLNCPLPILRAKKALTELKSGEVLRILATDPGSVKDFAAFSRQTGNDLLSSTENNKEFEFYMRRK